MKIVFLKEPFGLRFAGTLLLRFDLVLRLENALVVVDDLTNSSVSVCALSPLQEVIRTSSKIRRSWVSSYFSKILFAPGQARDIRHDLLLKPPLRL